jgi:MarR family transcriptional regulator, organic hydroperoxide resistance regulator
MINKVYYQHVANYNFEIMKYENLNLNNQLCFALYSATHAITRVYRSALESTGITYTQYLVMLVLWENNQLSVKTVADRLDLDSASLTPILKRLEVAGFVSRQRNKLDERVVEISLTTKGLALQDEVANIQNRVACQTGLPPDQFNQLKQSLNKLADDLRANEVIDINTAA